jgi:hypothetical protein
MKTMGIKIQRLPGKRLSQAIFLILLSTLLGGCMGSYGNYNLDNDVLEAFSKNQVAMDYRYYYYHSGSEPIAVIGVEKKYDAGSRMWREVDPNSEKFKELVAWIWEDIGYHRFGARINDPAGRQVGVLYTAIREVAIKFVGDNRIVVMPHTPFLWGPTVEKGDEYYGSTEINSSPSNRFRASTP